MSGPESPAPESPDYDLGRPDSPPRHDYSEFNDEALEKLERDIFDDLDSHRSEDASDPKGKRVVFEAIEPEDSSTGHNEKNANTRSDDKNIPVEAEKGS